MVDQIPVPSPEIRQLLQWDTTAIVGTSAGEQKTRVTGEAVLRIHGDHETRRGVSVARFGLAGASVRSDQGETGVITVIGTGGTGLYKDNSALRIELECTINFEMLDRLHGKNTTADCYYIPATEPCSAVIEGKLTMRGKTATLSDARILIACAAGESKQIQYIRIDLGRVTLRPIAAPRAVFRDPKPGADGQSNADANICVQVNRRRLIVQPVAYRASAGDPSPSGTTAAAQLATAQTVWGKCCIEIQVQPTEMITDATIKTSSSESAIRASFTDPDPNVIEIYFVQNPLSGTGGGNAGGIGVASCKVVIAEPNAGNPVLLSHELGHVLGLLHPPSVNSEANTVMVPTGSANNPGVPWVTHFMCADIDNPVLQTLPDLCCLTHDIPDHYIRDFPTDTGVEPSGPPPAGITQYANSYVWNRQENLPGSFHPVTGPDHQNPARWAGDMSTPHTNFLFARVEQRNNWAVRNAEVKFFIKPPGSAGGAANLTLLGQVAVPGTLAVGMPVDVSIPWQVPEGLPSHSCVFAVVTSAAEQSGDQSTLDWWGFENLAHVDNDWAQRNLDIEDFSSGNTGAGNAYESAPFFIFLPPADARASRMTLEIDAAGAKGLTDLVLDVVGGRSIAGRPGAVTKGELDLANRRDPYVVILRATLPSGLKPGAAFTVNVNPSVGDRAMVGFGATWRIADFKAVMDQTMDVAAAAFGDISTFAELPSAHAIFCRLGRGCRGPYSTADLARLLSELRGLIEALIGELKALPAAQATGAIEALDALLRALDAFGAGKADEHDVNGAFRAAANRIMASACILAGKV